MHLKFCRSENILYLCGPTRLNSPLDFSVVLSRADSQESAFFVLRRRAGCGADDETKFCRSENILYLCGSTRLNSPLDFSVVQSRADSQESAFFVLRRRAGCGADDETKFGRSENTPYLRTGITTVSQ